MKFFSMYDIFIIFYNRGNYLIYFSNRSSKNTAAFIYSKPYIECETPLSPVLFGVFHIVISGYNTTTSQHSASLPYSLTTPDYRNHPSYPQLTCNCPSGRSSRPPSPRRAADRARHPSPEELIIILVIIIRIILV